MIISNNSIEILKIVFVQQPDLNESSINQIDQDLYKWNSQILKNVFPGNREAIARSRSAQLLFLHSLSTRRPISDRFKAKDRIFQIVCEF